MGLGLSSIMLKWPLILSEKLERGQDREFPNWREVQCDQAFLIFDLA